ncbi:MAG: HAMP domain-containing protein [Planctomycetes bacterium]|nr:HAMP domain-containing protein [Planctomycetota bacterium]
MRMRLVRISLAVKYRILFGLAVLLIIGAALFVPLNVLESLVLEQPFREAQRIADTYFRHSLSAAPESGGSMHMQETGLLLADGNTPPIFIKPFGDAEDAQTLLNQLPAVSDRTFVLGAMRKFIRTSRQEHDYRTVDTPDGRRFLFARALRANKSCLSCHGEGTANKPVYREHELAGMILVDLPFEQSREQLIFSRLAILAAGLLAGILAILVFYVIVRRFILSPIHELREVALRVTEGDLEVRSTVETGDEFQQLSDNLNAMLERLRASQDELRKANKLLDTKLGEMAETNVTLYESNRVKGEFLANVTHELRTPLTSIIGFAELLREGPAGEANGKTARYAENILISGRILLEIINDLLDLAKIEAGKVELKLEPVRLDELCTSLSDFMRPMADKRQLTLETQAEEDLPILIVDRGRLRQVLFNLLSNALKFTPEGGRVELRCRRDGREFVRIEVRDSGPGIAPEHQAIIFDKFRQIDGSTTREHHGTGLGLAIAKELTAILGGQIGVASELGAGALFWIRLPHATPEPSPRPPISLT